MKEVTHGHDDHSSPIKTPKQLIVTVILAFVVPIVVIILLVKFVAYTPLKGEGSQAMTNEAISQRLAPIAQVVLIDASAPRVFKDGESVYKETCTSCHGAGIAGAPKVGDAAAWGPRLKQGAQLLFEHAIKGFTGKAGAMPAKGGNPDLDDLEVERAVVFMANASGGKLKEPEAPAAAKTAGAPTASAAAEAVPAEGAPDAQASDAGKPSSNDKTSGGTPEPAVAAK